MGDASHSDAHADGAGPDAGDAVPPIDTIAALARALGEQPAYIRYSEGPSDDLTRGSIDTESGLELPGLSVNPLDPEPWWTRPVEDWLARQLCQYKHLHDRNPDRRAWLVRGRVVGRGPDCEPLLADVEFEAELDETLLAEAEERYHERFDAGTGPEGPE
ncbi:DUF6098 family protein [Agromyces sp. G08B096]|uniref:DUF6098 family protein n=1 Tax=Agromyces sp. G08B096 TaxID=3156399 RepID=A0AAU7W973_9MICO